MHLTEREKWLIHQAYEAGYAGLYADSTEWLESDEYDTGDTVEDQLVFGVDQIEGQD